MSYSLSDKLVVGIASSALFDLTESDRVFRERGEDEYRRYQEEHIEETLEPGVAFEFIRRLLSLNDLSQTDDTLVEVIVLSRNDPETGLRVMRSVQTYGLDISRAIFMQGRSPYAFMGALDMSLFLSANEKDVKEAINQGLAAGQVLGRGRQVATSKDLRIAFDFDGVLAGDSSERIMQEGGLPSFHAHEAEQVAVPMEKGPLSNFLRGLNRIQDIEDNLAKAARNAGESYDRRVHVAIVTARNAPAHERVIRTLKSWGLRVNDAFFLGGIEKAKVLRVLRPHIFFDDQSGHLVRAQDDVPSVHVPFGKINERAQEVGEGPQGRVEPRSESTGWLSSRLLSLAAALGRKTD